MIVLFAVLSTFGYNTCPTCGPSLVSERHVHLHKVIYPNNHCFLPPSHQNHFIPSIGVEPYKWTMFDWANHWKEHWDTNPIPNGPPKGMSRLSILLRLPYWSILKIQHLLDPMHIFKNVAQIIWEHLISKRDSLGAREDMRSIKRLPAFAMPRVGPSGKMVLPKAPWILAKVEQDQVKGLIVSI